MDNGNADMAEQQFQAALAHQPDHSVLDFLLGVPVGIIWIGMHWIVSFLGFA